MHLYPINGACNRVAADATAFAYRALVYKLNGQQDIGLKDVQTALKLDANCAEAYWAKGEKVPWLLATNVPDRDTARRDYARRMWIEEMFGDLKDHGFDLEATHLRHFQRLSRLTLAICLLYVWLVLIGQQVIRSGQLDIISAARPSCARPGASSIGPPMESCRS